ncbi:MAG: outer membrane lipoprotein-sorting protein [Armatimonadota bacterium]|nr:outer membrane lipoprotein-sorting protein [Armatimonadota bacterium]MDW8143487.1 outer membrane lipoprotein-sorting protein [Armatimonadota bacterium]
MRFLVLVSLALTGFALAESEQPSAFDILRNMATVRSISYIVTAETVRLKPQTSSATATIYFKAGRRRVVYGDRFAPALAVLDDGKSVYRLLPRWRVAVRMPIVSQKLNFDLLRKNYELRLLPSEQVAGRDCYVLVAQPKHQNNPARKVWVDKTHFVILKDELIDSDGTPIRVFVVRSVNFNADIDESLFSVPSGWQVANAPYRPIPSLSLAEAEKIAGFKVRPPQFVPEGYQLSSVGVTYCQHGTPVVHLQYSDGLNTISVFERPAQCRSPRGRLRLRWGWRRQQTCDWLPQDDFVHSQIVNDLRVIVIGHPSQPIMQQIAESVR